MGLSVYQDFIECLLCVSFVINSALNIFSFFFFNDTATTEIYTLSLHDALPIWVSNTCLAVNPCEPNCGKEPNRWCLWQDRKSTRLNSSHGYISYAVFCLKKKKNKEAKDSPKRRLHISKKEYHHLYPTYPRAVPA